MVYQLFYWCCKKILQQVVQEGLWIRVWIFQVGSQVFFLICLVFECLFEGICGLGKIDVFLVDFCQYVGQGYGVVWCGVLFCVMYKQFFDVVVKSKVWFKFWFLGVKFNESDYVWIFFDGEQFLLCYMVKVDDYDNYYGYVYLWIGWEEFINWVIFEMYFKMFFCCCLMVLGMFCKVCVMINLYGKGYNWVKLWFRLFGMWGKIIIILGEFDCIVIYGYISENCILLDVDFEYINCIWVVVLNFGQIVVWFDGSWDIIFGGMFDDLWWMQIYVVWFFQVLCIWMVDRFFDWGSSKFFLVGWWVELDGMDLVFLDGCRMCMVRGDLFCIGEWYGFKKGMENEGFKMLVVDIVEGICLREVGMGFVGWVKLGFVDFVIWFEENGNCIECDMWVKGIRWEWVDNVCKQGWEQFCKRLKNFFNLDEMDEFRFIVCEVFGVFVVGECCFDFVCIVLFMLWDEKDLDDVDIDVEDYVGDDFCYCIMYKWKVVWQGSF